MSESELGAPIVRAVVPHKNVRILAFFILSLRAGGLFSFVYLHIVHPFFIVQTLINIHSSLHIYNSTDDLSIYCSLSPILRMSS